MNYNREWFRQLTVFLKPVATLTARPASRLGLAVALALATFGGAALAETDCVLDSLYALAPIPAPDSATRTAALKLLSNRDEIASEWLDIGCTGGHLSEMTLRLAPGEQRLINLVAEAGVVMPPDLGMDASGEPTSGEWRVFLRALSVTEDGNLQARPFTEHESRLTQLFQLEISAGSDNQPGQRQVMRVGGSTGFLLVIEDSREERLFRDQFRIDPTLGQFSQRTKHRAGPERDPGPISGSSSL